MVSTVESLLVYILSKYPYANDLSASRIAKLVYLVDWKFALEYDKQLTDTSWHFNHHGPYVSDFLNIAKNNDTMSIEETTNIYGSRKQLFKLNYEHVEIHISDEVREIVDFVIKATCNKNHDEFIKLVYSTYPVISGDRHSPLNLVEKAREYRGHMK